MASLLHLATHRRPPRSTTNSEAQVQVHTNEQMDQTACSQETSTVSMADAGAEKFTDPKCADRLLAVVSDCWTSGLYTDVTVIVKWEKFPANRMVLAAMSDFFRPLFEMDERNSEVTIQNMEPHIFWILLEFAYTGQLKLTCETVQNILIAADYLSVTFVKSACETFMGQNLEVDNVCEVWAFTKIMPLPTLTAAVQDFLCHHLVEVQDTEDFPSVDPDDLAQFLRSDDLVLYTSDLILRGMEREKAVCMAVLTYMSRQDVPVEDKIFWQLMLCVRLPMVPKEEMKDCLKAFRFLKKDPRFQEFLGLRKVMDKYTQQMRGQTDLAPPQDIPATWFSIRKLSASRIHAGPRTYASGGHIAPVSGPPAPPHNDLNMELAAIDIYIRRWDGRPVIGSLTITYRSPQGPIYKTYGKFLASWTHHHIELQPNETIKRVTIGSGYLIDRLGFKTSKGRTLGPFGGPGGSQQDERAPSGGQLLDFACDVVQAQSHPAIYNLQIRWLIIL